jgi:hypothetical protein
MKKHEIFLAKFLPWRELKSSVRIVDVSKCRNRKFDPSVPRQKFRRESRVPRQKLKLKLYAIMKSACLFLFCASIGLAFGADEPPNPRPLFPDDPLGTNLPVGVPRMVDTNGNVISINHGFTTPQYRLAAIQLLLQEANRVAKEMQFTNEVLPITGANVKEIFVPPFGFAYIHKAVGVVSTSNYVYAVSGGDKLSGLDVADYDQVCLKFERTSLPLEQMDTNAAYQSAIQWLAKASMDVKGLNRDCKAHVAVSAYWNGLAKLGQMPKKNFVPIYYIWWTTPKNDADGFGGVVQVSLFLPTKTLIHMTVKDPKYVLRQPLVFTNLASLFPGIGRITVLPNKMGTTMGRLSKQ